MVIPHSTFFMSVEVKLEMVLLVHTVVTYMSGLQQSEDGTPILRRIPSKNTRIAKEL